MYTLNIKQESPPAWTQEAYCSPCSEYSFCCPNWVPPLSWPGLGGYPAGGYPTWVPPSRVPPFLAQGVPCQGVPYLGTPHPDLAGGYPTWVPLAGYSPSWPGWGVPYLGTPGRVLPILTWQGTPSILTWQSTSQQGNPPSWPGRVPPQLDLAGYPPPGVSPMKFWVMLQSIMGYGYPPQVWTDKQSETITFPSYCVRGR